MTVDFSGEDTTPAARWDSRPQFVLRHHQQWIKERPREVPLPGPDFPATSSLTELLLALASLAPDRGSGVCRWLIEPGVTAPARAAGEAGSVSIWHFHFRRLKRWEILITLEGTRCDVSMEWHMSQSSKSKLVPVIRPIVLNLSSFQNYEET